MDIEEDDMSSLDEFIHQINPYTSANDDKGLSTSLTFEDTHKWMEELRTLACEEGQLASKKTSLKKMMRVKMRSSQK